MRIVFAYGPRTSPLFTSEHYERLASFAELPDSAPIAQLSDERLTRADVLITHWGCPPIGADILANAPRLRFIAHAAGSVKGHVTEAVFDRGIRVSSAAAAQAIPVAEYTLAAILWSGAARGNYGRVIGVVGASRVGRRVIELLRPFDFEVLVYDPHLDENLGVEHVRELNELIARSDVVTLHAPALDSTRHMIGAAQLAAMRDQTTFINTARGALVDHEALLAQLRTGRIAAVLDVTDPEPLPADSELRALENVILTPHIAGPVGAEVFRSASLAVDEVERFCLGLPLEHEVRRDEWDVLA